MGNWRVSDGQIPESVLEWLENKAGFYVWHGSLCIDTSLWECDGPWEFEWPHSRPPTLAEAILAVSNE